MKTILRHYGPVAALLAGILVVATLLSLFVGHGRADDPRPQVVVTTYPLYLAAQNVLGDTDGVRLTMLSGVGAGCLHDYQLSPADRLALERADKVIINGAGAEPFLEGLVEESRRVNTAERLDLICADGHHHHGWEEHYHEEETYNEHVWLSPECYGRQVQAVLRALCILNPEMTAVYEENAYTYYRKIDRIAFEVETYRRALSGKPCVLFHDSLSYLASDVGLDVKLTLSAEGESGLSAADLARVEALAKEHPDLVLLYDTQYPIRYAAIDGLVPADQVIALETAVVGNGKPSDWLDAMGRNLEKLQKLTGGDTMSHCGLHCLKINHITVRAGGETLVEDVSLHAHCGEITAVIGRNGAGKSTLFKAILGEIPHQGQVVFTGHNGTPAQKKPRIGYVPQSLNLDEGSPATVLDMALTYTSRWPAFLPAPRRLRWDIAAHFARFDAADLLDKPAGRLSGGEWQRVLLAIATRPHPDMLVLDEPVSGVDKAGLVRFYEMLEQLRLDDMVILIISHDLDFVRQHADRVVLLDRCVLAKGAPADVFAGEAFANAFPTGGEPHV